MTFIDHHPVKTALAG